MYQYPCIIDIDECENNNTNSCGMLENCVNTIGSYECQCIDGLIRDVNNQCVGKLYMYAVTVYSN